MQRRYNLTYFMLAMVVLLGLTVLMMGIDAQAQIAFNSDRDGDMEIYVMEANGGNPRRLTKNRHNDYAPAWFGPAFSVSPANKKITMWGWLKQIAR